MSTTHAIPTRAAEPDRPSTSDPPGSTGSDDTATAPFHQPTAPGTHRVHNQAPPLLGYDPLCCDPALVEAVRREGAGEALPSLRQLGALITSAEAAEHARLAETHPPVLHTHDRYGHRIDDVEFHPSWHWRCCAPRSAGACTARRGWPNRAPGRTSPARPAST